MDTPVPSTDIPKPPTARRPSHAALAVSGMTCAACAVRIESGLKAVPGVIGARVNLVLERADVDYDSASTSPEGLIGAVRDAGYDAKVMTTAGAAPPESSAAREGLAVLISALLTAPLVAQMAAHTFEFDVHLTPWTEAILAAPVQFVLGARFYAGSWRALRAGAANMDVLVALGTTMAYALSFYLVVTKGITAAGHLYFEGSAVIITLVLLGKWLEARAKRGTTEAIRLLMALRPATARVLREGAEIELAVAEVRRDDLIVVRPGEKIAVDGVIVEGEADCDEALITGESLPVARGVGQRVIGGAINLTGRLIVRATAVGEDSTLAKIVALVQSAQTGKAPVQRLVDRISAVFVPAVIVLAVLAIAAWLLAAASVEHALIVGVSVLVIACPCALGLATPTALVTGLGAAARAGILIKDIDALERAHNVTAIVFDKTGTLTQGKPAVTGFYPLSGDEREILQLAAGTQDASEHPLAKAMVDLARARGIATLPVAEFVNHRGRGVTARVADHRVLIGNRALMDEHRVVVSAAVPAAVAQVEERGETPVLIAVDGAVRAVVAVADPPRPQSITAVQALASRGVASLMLSGDTPRVAALMGARFGIADARGGVKPEDKAREIARLKAEGRVVAMVGDGVNDAPALAAADVGIAMGGATDVAMETAAITLLRPDPRLVAAAIDISRATWRKIRQNLFWAFIYNVVGVPLAALGLLTPALAGAAMAASSVSVVTNALLLKRWRPDLPDNPENQSKERS